MVQAILAVLWSYSSLRSGDGNHSFVAGVYVMAVFAGLTGVLVLFVKHSR